MKTNTYRSKGYWEMVRISNEDREYPSNMGEKWSDEEEILLLEELNNNIDIEIIAQKHKDWVNIARSFGAKTEAEDMVQEMYIRLDKYIKPDQKISTSFVWITLRNIYFDFLKKEPITFELDKTVSEAICETESIIAYEELNKRVRDELNNVDWFDKMIF